VRSASPSPLLELTSDLRLAALAGHGSRRAFDVLVARHRSELAAHCRRVTGSTGAAEDALQQALLAAWVALQDGPAVCDPRAWLHRIARNASLDAVRRAARAPVELPDTLAGSSTTEQLVEGRLELARTFDGIAALPDEQREALVRTAFDGAPYETVAAELGVPGSTVRGLVQRARSSLRSAAALLPLPFLRPPVEGGRPSLLERLAELAPAAPAGAVALAAKSGAAVVAAGAVAVGTGVAPGVDRPGVTAGAPARAQGDAARAIAAAVGRPGGRVRLAAPSERAAAAERPAATDDASSARPRERAAREAGEPRGDVAADAGATPLGRSGAPPVEDPAEHADAAVGREQGQSPAGPRAGSGTDAGADGPRRDDGDDDDDDVDATEADERDDDDSGEEAEDRSGPGEGDGTSDDDGASSGSSGGSSSTGDAESLEDDGSREPSVSSGTSGDGRSSESDEPDEPDDDDRR